MLSFLPIIHARKCATAKNIISDKQPDNFSKFWGWSISVVAAGWTSSEPRRQKKANLWNTIFFMFGWTYACRFNKSARNQKCIFCDCFYRYLEESKMQYLSVFLLWFSLIRLIHFLPSKIDLLFHKVGLFVESCSVDLLPTGNSCKT